MFESLGEGDQSELEKAWVIKTDVAFISVIEFRKSNAGLGPWEPVTPHDTKNYRSSAS